MLRISRPPAPRTLDAGASPRRCCRRRRQHLCRHRRGPASATAPSSPRPSPAPSSSGPPPPPAPWLPRRRAGCTPCTLPAAWGACPLPLPGPSPPRARCCSAPTPSLAAASGPLRLCLKNAHVRVASCDAVDAIPASASPTSSSHEQTFPGKALASRYRSSTKPPLGSGQCAGPSIRGPSPRMLGRSSSRRHRRCLAQRHGRGRGCGGGVGR